MLREVAACPSPSAGTVVDRILAGCSVVPEELGLPVVFGSLGGGRQDPWPEEEVGKPAVYHISASLASYA